MSSEDLSQLLEAVREDSSLQEKLDAEGADPIALAKEAGFSSNEPDQIHARACHLQIPGDGKLENPAGEQP